MSKIDLSDFGIEEEEIEQEEEEVSTPEPAKEEKDTTDRSVPLLQRIDKEIEQLKLATGIMADYQMQAATTLAQMIKCYLTDKNTQISPKYIEEKWDSNGWTFPKLWEAIYETAKKELNSKSCGVSGEVVWGWASHLILDCKPTEKKETPPSSTKAVKTAKKKEEPKKEYQQLTLDLSDF